MGTIVNQECKGARGQSLRDNFFSIAYLRNIILFCIDSFLFLLAVTAPLLAAAPVFG